MKSQRLIKIFDSFGVDFCSGWAKESPFILLCVDTHFPQDHLLKRLSFLRWVFLVSLTAYCSWVGLDLGPLFYSFGLWVCFGGSSMLFLLRWLFSMTWNRYDDTSHSTSFAQSCLGCPASFMLRYELWDYFSNARKNVFGIFLGIKLNV